MRSVDLEHLDPAAVDVEACTADPDTLVEPHAGRSCTGCAERWFPGLNEPEQ